MNDLAIVWFRRDLRLADNPALDQARKRYRRVLPVYIHDPDADGDWAPGAAARWWLHHALVDLDARLRERGAALYCQAGAAGEVLAGLVERTGAAAVYWNRLYEPARVERDAAIKKSLKSAGVEARSLRGSVLFEPWELLREDDAPYKVFTPFFKRMQRTWRTAATVPEPRQLTIPDNLPEGRSVDSLALEPRHSWTESLARHWEIGELAARRRLKGFIDQAVGDYPDRRNRPDSVGTSRLSPYLHWGQISPRQAVEALTPSGELPLGKGALSFVRELAWREFSIALLYHWPNLDQTPMQPKFHNFPWRKPAEYAEDLIAWQRGATGVPLVDAGMRELWATGWMHNRVRMVVASFLTKNLLIPWQEGANWFWDTLVDADLANNTQGWQWTAGCGADAAPYFRVFNPELQAEKFDPQARYIRHWCPELEGLSVRELSRLDRDQRERRGYPPPLVDLKASRKRALEAFQAISG